MLCVNHALQGANGLVRSTGDGYWLYNDVLITYTPAAPEGRRRKWLALVVALPVVLGVLLLVGGVALAWWIRKKCSRWVAVYRHGHFCLKMGAGKRDR